MLVFKNEGLVPLEAFTTFGMSAKPSSTNPIGKFGTGLKYAIAGVLRLGGTFRLFRGHKEYEFYTKPHDFRGKEFALVRMRKRNGITARWSYEQLPFTTELGKHWMSWMILRELEANVRDENGFSYVDQGTSMKLQEGTTVIMIECPEIEEAYASLDKIFLPDRVPLYETDLVKVYEGESDHIYYRQMRVTDLRSPSLYTYEMKHVYLTEDRTSQFPFLDNNNIMKSLLKCTDEKLVRRIVEASSDYHESTFDWDSTPGVISDTWRETLFTSDLSPRMRALRNNLRCGISASEEVSISLTVSQWEEILGHTDHEVTGLIEQALRDAGWIPEDERSPEDEGLPEDERAPEYDECPF